MEQRGVRAPAEVLEVYTRPAGSLGPANRQFEFDGCTGSSRKFAEVRFSPADGSPVVAKLEIGDDRYGEAKEGTLEHVDIVYLPEDPDKLELASVNRNNATYFPIAAALWLALALFFLFGAFRFRRSERRARPSSPEADA